MVQIGFEKRGSVRIEYVSESRCSREFGTYDEIK